MNDVLVLHHPGQIATADAVALCNFMTFHVIFGVGFYKKFLMNPT